MITSVKECDHQLDIIDDEMYRLSVARRHILELRKLLKTHTNIGDPHASEPAGSR